jgi:3',5'-nucleoside bisphosphate phosphatase
MIDLHTHSTASDGTDSPAELVAAAAAAGVTVLGITDHDTTAGWDDALAARPAGMTIVPGTEFSCRYVPAEGRRISLHLLAYLFDAGHPALRAERARLRESRLHRARQMVEHMTADGIPISWAAVAQLAGNGPVGRPHLARALVAADVVPDVDTAFRELLSSRQPYYVPKADTDVFTAIELVRAAGGIPVFAHPLARRRGPVVTDEVIAQMTDAGLVGLEVDHPDQDDHDRKQASGIARELGLVQTGSSDYHGANKRTPIAVCTTSPDQYEALIGRPTARRPEWG